MIEWGLIAVLGWFTYDQAGDIGQLEQSNKQFSQTITDNNTALEQCYEDITENKERENIRDKTIKRINGDARQTLLELESLRNSSESLRDFNNCVLPDEIWQRIAPSSKYGIQNSSD